MMAVSTQKDNPGKLKNNIGKGIRNWYTGFLFDILEKNNLYVKPEKCAFEQDEMEYLGVIVGKGKAWMDLKKLMAVANYMTPQNTTNVHTFLGFTGYYWYFIQGYLQVTWPLLDLTKKRML
jgi:hypothetical protein